MFNLIENRIHTDDIVSKVSQFLNTTNRGDSITTEIKSLRS